MKQLTFFVFILTLCVTQVTAQNTRSQKKYVDALSVLREKSFAGKFNISLDSLIEQNYYRHLVQNSKNAGITGYRIRIFSDTGQGAKDNQRVTRERFLSKFPEIKAYYRYEGSYYKIYVGDFRTKRDAIMQLDEIKKSFPDAFIVADNIEIEN